MMVTRKPVPGNKASSSPAESSVAFEPAAGSKSSAPDESDWDNCDRPASDARLNIARMSDLSALDTHSSFAPTQQFAQQSTHSDIFTQDQDQDHSPSNMSLDAEQHGQSNSIQDQPQSSNPFRRPHGVGFLPADVGTAAAWNMDKYAADNGAAPQLSIPDQAPLIQLDDENFWSDTSTAPQVAKVTQDTTEDRNQRQGKGKAPEIGSTQHIRHVESSAVNVTGRAGLESPSTRTKSERSEVYQIKHIRWHDASYREVVRYSPILIQNANGPCPLLALVNALVLTTPADFSTPLIENLRTREQISLGLLLDAVFDELMSNRRSGSQLDIPDVSELYAFLVSLHQGMNVNPRFVSESKDTAVSDKVSETLPGFENTREMKLYGTFQIPLLHGWVPHKHEPASRAFERLAPTYEEAQNVQFREEELQQKLNSNQFTPDDENALNDLTVIKQFLSYWPTQLTGHGLDVIQKSMRAGEIAILFRNDHFSMLYMEPRNRRLMTLVTDAGYATHDEIVWESLVDINGSCSEWYSGDFRSVSHTNVEGADYQDYDDWTTVAKKGAGQRTAVSRSSNLEGASATLFPPAGSSPAIGEKAAMRVAQAQDSPASSRLTGKASEQEDMDLALALQLQEEEEERERNEAAIRRAHENDLSRQYISQQAGDDPRSAVQIPPRRSGQVQAHVQSPAPPAMDRTIEQEDESPPSYQEAAAARPYHPPRSHPSHPSSEQSPLIQSRAYTQHAAALGQSSTASRRRLSARQSLVNQIPPGNGTGPPRRQSRIETGMNSPHMDRREGCFVM